MLNGRGIEPRLIAYLETPPTIGELQELLERLGFADVRQLMRKSEADYATLRLDDPALSQEALLAALSEHPQLIERPVFVHEDRAVIGRPPERVLEIL